MQSFICIIFQYIDSYNAHEEEMAHKTFTGIYIDYF